MNRITMALTESFHLPEVPEPFSQWSLAVTAGNIVLAADEDKGDSENHGGHSAPQLQLLFSVEWDANQNLHNKGWGILICLVWLASVSLVQ